MKTKTVVTLVLITAVCCFGICITRAEAGNTARVSVSCRIPSLLEMKTDRDTLAAAGQERMDASSRVCVQEEAAQAQKQPQAPQLMVERAHDSAKLYSFYER